LNFYELYYVSNFYEQTLFEIIRTSQLWDKLLTASRTSESRSEN